MSSFDSSEIIIAELGAWRYEMRKEEAAELAVTEAAQLPGTLCSQWEDGLL